MPRLRSAGALANIRGVRASTAEGRALLAPVLRFRRHWVRSNVAYFVVCSPTPPSRWSHGSYLAIQPLEGHAPRAASACRYQEYLILARSNADMHSERRAVEGLFGHFGERARVTLAFSEREPCHEGGGCRALLQGVLRTNGAAGVDTPVRYLFGYLNSQELAMAALMSGTTRLLARRQHRGWATEGIRRRVRGA